MTRGSCSAAVRASVRRAGQTVQITAQRQPLTSLDPKVGQHARSCRRDVPAAVRSGRLSEALFSASRAGLQLRRPCPGHQRAGHRHPQLSVGVRGVRAGLAARGPAHAVRAIHERRSRQSRRLPLDGEPLTLSPSQPHYPGKVVILVDEVSQSQAEYTAMAFRSAPQAMVVGSTTAGADGNVSQIPLPGGLSTMISGIGVFYPGQATHSARRHRRGRGSPADDRGHPRRSGRGSGRGAAPDPGTRDAGRSDREDGWRPCS